MARMRFADTLDANALTLTPILRAVGRGNRFMLDASGTLSRLGDAWSNAGSLDATAVAARRGIMALEFGALAGGSVHSGGGRTGQMLGSARLRAGFASGAVWAGGGLGRTWDSRWRALRQLDAGGWLARGPVTMAFDVLPTVVDDTIRYTDTFFMWGSGRAPWSVSATVGLRAGEQLPTLPANRKTWGNIAATFDVDERFSLVASGGTYPVDFTQGYPGGQFLSFGVRIRGQSGIASPYAAAVAAPVEGARAFRVDRVEGGARFRVLAPGASRVELSGDFTGWQPVTLLERDGGWWEAVIPVPPGTYEASIRLDGGRWIAPPGTVERRDEFGTLSGVVTVR